jgi:lysyl-tRNA synthetase class 2
MALSEQEIIQRKTSIFTQPWNQSLSCKPFSCNPYFKAGQRNFEDGKTVTVAGRLMSVRDQGKACFAELQDSGRIQLYLNRDVLCPGEDKTVYNQVLKIN